MFHDDHDLSRLADDGCPHHCDDDPSLADCPVYDDAVEKLLADTRLHEAS